jgi:hypothetical protein
MLCLTMRRAELESDADLTVTFADFVQSVSDYRAVLQPSIEAQAVVLGVAAERLQPLSTESSSVYAEDHPIIEVAELLARDDELFVLIIKQEPARLRPRRGGDKTVAERQPGEHRFEVYCIGPNVVSSHFEDLVGKIQEAFGIELEKWSYKSQRFDELINEGKETATQSTPEELAASKVLADRATRTLVTAIKSSSGLLRGDLEKQVPAADRDRTQEIVSELESSSLVEAESVISCTKTGAQVARVADAAALADPALKVVRCACGRTLSEERCEEALAISDLGRSLIDGSRWLTLLLVDELTRIGVPLDHIILEYVSGGDEMDCIAVLSGEMILFELKDKPFNLGNAYSFGAKIGIMKPEHSVVITTEHVGADAKEHFQKAQEADSRTRHRLFLEMEGRIGGAPTYIENLDHLRSGLEELATQVMTADAARVLKLVLARATPDAASLLTAFQQTHSPS